MRRRKLITKQTMLALIADLDIGVPLARAMRNHNITMSRPAVHKLVVAYMIAEENDKVRRLIIDSLFPAWLTTDEQEQPDNIKYEGYFPYGVWL